MPTMPVVDNAHTRAQLELATQRFAALLGAAIEAGLEHEVSVGLVTEPCTERAMPFAPSIVTALDLPPARTAAPAPRPAPLRNWARPNKLSALFAASARRERRPPVGKFSLLDLGADTCRWPLGDGPYFFCGAKPAAGCPYCATHFMRSIAPRCEESVA